MLFLNLFGIEPSRLESLSKLPCRFIICIFLTRSANESDLLITTVSSSSIGFGFPFVGDGGGRLSVNDSSTLSKFAAVWRRRTGSWRFTMTSSMGFGKIRWFFATSSRSGVEDQDEGLCRNLKGAVISTTLLLSFDVKFCVEVQLRTDLSSVSRLRLGVDEAMSSPRLAPCSL